MSFPRPIHAPESPRIAAAAGVLFLSLLVVGYAYGSACHGECEIAHDLAEDGAGRIVVVGYGEGSGSGDVVLLRLTDDGMPDASFGDGGVVIGAGEGAAMDVSVTPDGTIVITQVSLTGITIRRYGPDGEVVAPVPNSAGDPDDRWPVASWGKPNPMAVDRAGSVVAAQHLHGEVPRDQYVVLRRYLPDGTEDTPFRHSAAAAYGVGPPEDLEEESQAVREHYYSQAAGIVIDDVDRIVVAGETKAGMTVWRFCPDGAPDSSFDQDGVVSLGDSDDRYGGSSTAVAIDEDGRLVVAGVSVIEGQLAMTIWCFASDGQPDRSFSDDGLVVFSMLLQEQEVATWTLAMGIDSASRIAVVGMIGQGTAVWRYLPDGTPDRSFGGTGYVALEEQDPRFGRFFGSAMIFDSSGRIVVAARKDGREYDFGVCRLLTDGSIDRSFGMDGLVVYDRGAGFWTGQ
jgi:uncharacterized delta-60 repeat protein